MSLLFVVGVWVFVFGVALSDDRPPSLYETLFPPKRWWQFWKR